MRDCFPTSDSHALADRFFLGTLADATGWQNLPPLRQPDRSTGSSLRTSAAGSDSVSVMLTIFPWALRGPCSLVPLEEEGAGTTRSTEVRL